MDPGMSAFAYIAAAAMAALGFALLVVPVRSMRALHEWYIVPPEIRPEQKFRVAICRMVGTGLVVGSCAFAISITYALGRAL
jgi:hypothetical protein